MADIRTKPATDAYRKGWEKIYGKKKKKRSPYWIEIVALTGITDVRRGKK